MTRVIPFVAEADWGSSNGIIWGFPRQARLEDTVLNDSCSLLASLTTASRDKCLFAILVTCLTRWRVSACRASCIRVPRRQLRTELRGEEHGQGVGSWTTPALSSVGSISLGDVAGQTRRATGTFTRSFPGHRRSRVSAPVGCLAPLSPDCGDSRSIGRSRTMKI
jgi:hypothetical protein